jgi:hypothetical protein
MPCFCIWLRCVCVRAGCCVDAPSAAAALCSLAHLMPFRHFEPSPDGSAGEGTGDPLLDAARCCAAIVGRALAAFFSLDRLSDGWLTGSPVPPGGPDIVLPSPLCAHVVVRAGRGAWAAGDRGVVRLKRDALAAAAVLVPRFSPATGACRWGRGSEEGGGEMKMGKGGEGRGGGGGIAWLRLT